MKNKNSKNWLRIIGVLILVLVAWLIYSKASYSFTGKTGEYSIRNMYNQDQPIVEGVEYGLNLWTLIGKNNVFCLTEAAGISDVKDYEGDPPYPYLCDSYKVSIVHRYDSAGIHDYGPIDFESAMLQLKRAWILSEQPDRAHYVTIPEDERWWQSTAWGNKKQDKVQDALWSVWGSHKTPRPETAAGQALLAQANRFADYKWAYSDPKILQQTKEVDNSGNYYKVGPFKVSYSNTGEFSGVRGDSAALYQQLEDGSEVAIPYDGWRAWYMADSNGNQCSNGGFPNSNEEFYIMVNADLGIDKLTKLTFKVWNQEAKGVYYQLDGTGESAGQQSMLAVAEGERYELEKPINIDCEVELKSFDLALQKFIVGVNEQTVTNRVPTPEYYKNDKNKRDVRYNYQFSKEAHPVETKTGDIVTYKIRIYNEGTRDGTATRIYDKIPEGLEYAGNLKTIDGKTNTENGWRYEGGVLTTNALEGETIKAWDKNSTNGADIDYKEVEIALRVTEPNMSTRILKNTSEIQSHKDYTGNINIKDVDSTPNNYDPNQNNIEDDTDFEYVKLHTIIDIGGFVWIDNADGKNSTLDQLYTNGQDFLKQNVNTRLYIVPSENKEVPVGDVNLDGTVTFEDCELIRDHIEGKRQLTQTQKVVADVNADGSIDQRDIVAIQAHIYNAIQFEKQHTGIYLKVNEPILVESAVTGSDGRYTFNYVNKTKAYYVEFEYDGQKYLPVNYRQGENPGGSNYGYNADYWKINSKVEENTANRESFNNRFGTVAQKGAINNQTGEVTALQYHKNTEKHTSTVIHTENADTDPNFMIRSRTFDSTKEKLNIPFGGTTQGSYFEGGDIEYLQYINLGLRVRPQMNLGLNKYFKEAEVIVGDKSSTYTRGEIVENGKTIPIQYSDEYAAWGYDSQNNTIQRTYHDVYEQKIYRSDYYLDGSASARSKNIEVYLTYKIQVNDYSSDYAGDSVINEIIDYNDKDTSFVDAWLEDGTKISPNTSQYGTVYHNGTEYKAMTFSGINQTIHNGEKDKNILYVRVKVDKDENGRLKMDQDPNDENRLLGGKQNVAEISAYSNPKGLIDTNSAPGNCEPGNVDTYEDDTGAADDVRLVFEKDPRISQGTVWDDSATATDEVGDGKRQDNEPKIGNVQVELRELVKDSSGNIVTNANGQPETLPALIYSDQTKGLIEAPYVLTDSNGNYQIDGYVPGDYVMKFVYGGADNTQYNAQEYKSTTYIKRSGVDDDQNRFNQVEEPANLLSDARDNIVRRQTLNQTWAEMDNQKAKQMQAEIQAGRMTMDAYTNKIDVTVKNPVNDTRNIDLGIEERPKTEIQLYKEIAGIKITLSNGTVLIDTANGVIPGVQIPDKPHDPKAIWLINMDEELMQGSTVEVTYHIYAVNQGERDFELDQGYNSAYYTGSQTGTPTKISITSVIDYVDDELVYVENEGWTQVHKNDLVLEDSVRSEIPDERVIVKTEETTKDTIAKGNNTNTTEAMTSNVVELKLSRVITPEKDELRYTNIAEIEKLTTTNGRKDENSTPGNQNPTEQPGERDTAQSPTTVITPPTGENKDYTIYFVLGTVVAVITIAGIILIKKKVLK